jgi:hypothetical protein
MIRSMSNLPELTAEFSSNRSPNRFTLLPLEGSERDAGRTCKADMRSRREFFGPVDVRKSREVGIEPYLPH